MDRKQKAITVVVWAVLVVAMLGVVGSGLWARLRDDSSAGNSLPTYYAAPSFALTDQDGKPFESRQLQGKPWVASFIFTNCPGVCPMMTQKMGMLQETVPDPEVQLVSFTVDPERDTPEVLRKYAERFKADLSRWHFLTGDKTALFAAAAGLKLTATPATESQPILHSDKFLLVDRAGQVRGIYDSKEAEDLKKLASDAAALARSR